MFKYLGLFTFLLSFNVSAEILFLRGHVPETFQVKIEKQNNKIKTRVLSNHGRSEEGPKVHVKKTKNFYLVSVVHP